MGLLPTGTSVVAMAKGREKRKLCICPKVTHIISAPFPWLKQIIQPSSSSSGQRSVNLSMLPEGGEVEISVNSNDSHRTHLVKMSDFTFPPNTVYVRFVVN